jgi:hypothetical protein
MPGKDPWLVASYEIDMHEQLSRVSVSARLIQNAITESRVLHARQLCEIFIPAWDPKPDDICLGHLVPGWNDEHTARFKRLRDLVEDLKRKFGRSGRRNSPCWVFNKKMAHATLERTDDYDYKPALSMIDSALRPIIAEIESVAGRTFRRQLESVPGPVVTTAGTLRTESH